MATTPPALPAWPVPAHWRRVEFISDLHLQSGDRATALAFQRYLHTCTADALWILGDLFEVWIGDDLLTGTPTADAELERERAFIADTVSALKAFSQRGWLGVMRGNRDFLLGEDFAQASRAVLVDDPCLLPFDGERYLLAHGDAWCLADHAYMRFRAEVRRPEWQARFLGRPLAERWAMARAMRAESQARQRAERAQAMAQPVDFIDLDAPTVRAWLQAQGARTLIHGHTHHPAQHALGQDLRRVVLSDWDANAQPPRLEVVRLEAGQGLTRSAWSDPT